MKTSFRTKVFKRAHEIKKVTGKSFAVCLSKAWAVYRLTKKMLSGITEFTFEKKDGSLRRAKGYIKPVTHSANQKKENYKTVPYFDAEKNAFRCFKVESLIAVI